MMLLGMRVAGARTRQQGAIRTVRALAQASRTAENGTGAADVSAAKARGLHAR
jgi:hypothetical protein